MSYFSYCELKSEELGMVYVIKSFVQRFVISNLI